MGLCLAPADDNDNNDVESDQKEKEPLEKGPLDGRSRGKWREFKVSGITKGGELTMQCSGHHISTDIQPLEYFAASIQSDFQVMINLVCTQKEVDIGTITWTTIMTVGTKGKPQKVICSAEIEMKNVDDEQKINEVVQVAQSRCPLDVLCRKMNIELILTHTFKGVESGNAPDHMMESADSNMEQVILEGVGNGFMSKISRRESSTVIIVDEPEAMGGSNEGANPIGYLGTAMESALHLSLIKVAKEKNIEIGDVEWVISVGIDAMGLMGKPGAVINPQRITGNVLVALREQDSSALTELVREVEERCALYAMCKAAGLELDVNYTVNNAEKQ